MNILNETYEQIVAQNEIEKHQVIADFLECNYIYEQFNDEERNKMDFLEEYYQTFLSN